MSASGVGSEYDIIFAGGGTVACVAAGRLAEADPSLRILVPITFILANSRLKSQRIAYRTRTGYSQPTSTHPPRSVHRKSSAD
ncbi:hypothetical protein PTI98_010250 [Pleurotus ostreatus]|nr:hypothetical protein PTI98_010250 [Pleurotus ostreatus]